MSQLRCRFPADADVVVAGLTSNGATALRNLAAKGLNVVGVSHDASEIGLRSRFGVKAVMPDPVADLDAWVAAMLDAAVSCTRRPVIIPTSDRFVLALDQAGDLLNGAYRSHGFGTGLRTALTSKRQTFDLAAKHDFPMPKSEFVDSRESLGAFARAVQGPVLIKPELPLEWRTKEARACLGRSKVLEASSPEEILSAYDRVIHLTPRLIAQEVIEGPDRNLLYWAGFVSPDGQVCGQLVGQKIRVRPVHMGSATFVQLVDMPELERLCATFLRGLGYSGICGIELKLDDKDGKPKLIEVNPRYGLWEDIGVPVGVDLLYDAVSAAFGETPPSRGPSSFDQKWVHFSSDFAAFLDYRKEGSLTGLSWLGSLKPPIIVNDFPILSDPIYSVHSFISMLDSAAQRFQKR